MTAKHNHITLLIKLSLQKGLDARPSTSLTLVPAHLPSIARPLPFDARF
jgi:hypothetical protein